MAVNDRDRKPFVYKPRSAASVRSQATQTSNQFDGIIQANIPCFKAKEGFNELRIMPATFANADHYGLKVHTHMSIGTDNGTYLCLDKMLGERCPICEERHELDRHRASAEELKALRINDRYIYWIIDRKNEDAGPQIWQVGWSMDKEIAGLCIDRKTSEVLLLDDPDYGYDIEFDRVGTDVKTKYESKKIARRESPLSTDRKKQEKWLEYITDHPLDEVLEYHDYDYIMKVLTGQKEKADPDLDEDHRQRRDRDRDEGRGSTGRGRIRDQVEELDDEIPYDRVGRSRVRDEAPKPEPEPETQREETTTRSRRPSDEPEHEPAEDYLLRERGRERTLRQEGPVDTDRDRPDATRAHREPVGEPEPEPEVETATRTRRAFTATETTAGEGDLSPQEKARQRLAGLTQRANGK